MNTATPMLQAINLSKSYQGITALESLNLKIYSGDVFCLLGANGAGKTTTINLFLGFIEPTFGEARIHDRNVMHDPIGSKKDLAYIPEQVALYPTLSGMENLKYLAALAGHENYSEQELYGFIEQVGLSRDQANRRVSTYSKGMRQKIGVASALAKHAKVFLLDEPLSGLDLSAANEFTLLVKYLSAQGAAILMATHDIFRAKELASTIGIMKSGKLIDEISPQSVNGSELETIYLNHMRSDSDTSVGSEQ